MKIAVIIPCYNEAKAIAQVVRSFKEHLPQATIYVYDNNSTDDTISCAKSAGAIVRRELMQGKGNVVRRMFVDVDADVYVMADGDTTYDAASAPKLVNTLIENHLDMVVGTRQTQTEELKQAYRFGHQFGNRLLTKIVSILFGQQFTDMLSGYRVFSRRFVKSFPLVSSGFEIETEITVHALQLKLPVCEVSTPYYSRPEGSTSKLRTYRDGFRILGTSVKLLKECKPIVFFGIGFMFFALLSLVLGIPIIENYLVTGLVPRMPTAILAASSMILAFMSLSCGIILDDVARGRLENKRMAYLSIRYGLE